MGRGWELVPVSSHAVNHSPFELMALDPLPSPEWSRDLRRLLRLFGLGACPGLGGQDHGSERHSALILRILLRMRWRVDALMPPYSGAATPRRIKM